jgi:hypothetical protein
MFTSAIIRSASVGEASVERIKGGYLDDREPRLLAQALHWFASYAIRVFFSRNRQLQVAMPIASALPLKTIDR